MSWLPAAISTAGSSAGLSKQRSRVSRGSNAIVRLLLGIELTDPMSGHFMIRREAVEALAPALSSQGFKILLDILATARGKLRTVELPSTFRERQHGESKLNIQDCARFRRPADRERSPTTRSPPVSCLFCLVGFTGIGIHLSILSALLATDLSFSAAQAFATSAPSRGISSSTIFSPTATSASPAGVSLPA